MSDVRVGQTVRLWYQECSLGTVLCEVRIRRRRGFFEVLEDIYRGREILGDRGKPGHRLCGTLDVIYPKDFHSCQADSRGEYRRVIQD